MMVKASEPEVTGSGAMNSFEFGAPNSTEFGSLFVHVQVQTNDPHKVESIRRKWMSILDKMPMRRLLRVKGMIQATQRRFSWRVERVQRT
jgi:hypothetical protein